MTIAKPKVAMSTEAAAPELTLVKVPLNLKQVTLLLGVTDIYSRRFLALQDTKIQAAKTVEEQKNLVYDAVLYGTAASELINALTAMADEGLARADKNNFDSFDVLFQPAEIKFLSSILGTSSLDTVTDAAVASGKYTRAEGDAAKELLASILQAFKSGVELTLEQVRAERDAAKKAAPFLFEQSKVGLA